MSSQRLCLCRNFAGISFDRLMHRVARYGTDTMRGYLGYLCVLQEACLLFVYIRIVPIGTKQDIHILRL